jgi:hypothetical protein
VSFEQYCFAENLLGWKVSVKSSDTYFGLLSDGLNVSLGAPEADRSRLRPACLDFFSFLPSRSRRSGDHHTTDKVTIGHSGPLRAS